MNSRFAIGAVLAVVMFVGCGVNSDMGAVSGVVTLDGKPVENVAVTFYPAGARSSVGYTQADGSYELIQTRERKGAMIGKHKVTITQERIIGEPFVKLNFPAKYGSEETTDLVEDVEGGSNEIDFDLKSK